MADCQTSAENCAEHEAVAKGDATTAADCFAEDDVWQGAYNKGQGAVKIGDLLLGNFHPVRVQTMTTTDTMDTIATVEQSIRCIEAGAELVRITAPSKKEAGNLLNIKNELRKRGYHTPLVADIHFTPNAAEIAARIVEKVRVNPGNFVDGNLSEFCPQTPG